MDWLLFYIWAAAALVPAVHGATSFIRPPNFDRGIDEDPSNNIRHEEGSSITVMWEIDLDKISLVYVQQLDNDRIQSTFLRGKRRFGPRLLPGPLTGLHRERNDDSVHLGGRV